MLFGKYFRGFYLKYGAYIFTGIVILVIINWIQLEIPLHIKAITAVFTDATKVSSSKEIIIANIKSILILATIIAIGRIFWRYLLLGTSSFIENDLRNMLFKHTTELSQDFYATNKVGKLMSYYTQDLKQIRQNYAFGLLFLVDIVFLGSFSIYRIFKTSWFVGVCALIPLIIIGITGFFVSRIESRQYKAAMKKYEQMSDFVQESYSGVSVVKAFVRNEDEAVLFREKAQSYKDLLYKFIKTVLKNSIFMSFITSLIMVIVILTVSLSVLNPPRHVPKLEPSDLILIILYVGTLMWPIRAVSSLIDTNSRAQASGKRITEFLDAKVTVKDIKNPIEISFNCEEDKNKLTVYNINSDIVFNSLNFQYPDEKTNRHALENINFTIKQGQMVGILGRTGSGKSTIVELLLRLYNIEENKIFIGGYDIMKLPIKAVRHIIGYVPQDNFLFTDTITNNIGFSYPFSTYELIKNPSKSANIYQNIIDFPEKFDTILGERGVTVSGGQKQRIAIARALTKDSKILILDDSVSALDTKTEESIIDNLKTIRKEKTTIFITHRISTMQKMDNIILMDEGKIIGVGTHDELLKTSVVYKNLVELQRLEKEVE